MKISTSLYIARCRLAVVANVDIKGGASGDRSSEMQYNYAQPVNRWHFRNATGASGGLPRRLLRMCQVQLRPRKSLS